MIGVFASAGTRTLREARQKLLVFIRIITWGWNWRSKRKATGSPPRRAPTRKSSRAAMQQIESCTGFGITTQCGASSPTGDGPGAVSWYLAVSEAHHRDLRSGISGKTTLALHILAQAQRWGRGGLVDAEHALTPPMPGRWA